MNKPPLRSNYTSQSTPEGSLVDMRMALRLSVKGSTSVNSSSRRAAVTTAMARVVPFPPWIFVLCFFLESGVVFAEGLKGTFAGGFSFANFVHHPFRYLNATQVGSHFVHEAEACNFACVRDISCVSLNVAAHPDIHGHFLCELLSSDKYNSSDQFLPHPDFDHHSIHVSSEFFTICIQRRKSWSKNNYSGFYGLYGALLCTHAQTVNEPRLPSWNMD